MLLAEEEEADEAFVLDVDPLLPPDEFGLADFEVFLLLAIGVVIAATAVKPALF